MSVAEVIVIGGGVAGLNTTRLLAAAGVSVRLLEARDRLGGRVLSVDGDGTPSDDGYDLGPSWFWPRLQPVLDALAQELGLASFPQSSDGDVVFERMSRERPGRYAGVRQEPESMRFSGGSTALVRALARRVPEDAIRLSSSVTGLELADGGVRATYRDASGAERHVDAEYAVAALPPRLLEATIAFTPAVPSEISTLWRDTGTWMAGQAKFFALYDSPFWLEDGLSGTAQSMVGPMLEMHDATTQSGDPALLGFLGVGPAERRAMGDRALTEACVAQLVRLFGSRAQSPRATIIKDWAADPLTATADDAMSSGHPAPAPSWIEGPWADRLLLAGSETSPHEAGYLAGAVEVSSLVASELRRRLGRADKGDPESSG